jgi:low affinity Fe/Cu permease
MSKKTKKQGGMKAWFERFSTWATNAAGSTGAFGLAAGIVVVWAVSGPIFNYSETWQLVINTGTTIITFLMVFLIQKSQNKDSLAVQLKLNELLASHKTASNRLVDIEDLTEDEIRVLQKFYIKLANEVKKDSNLQASHSIEEAENKSAAKAKRTANRKKLPSEKEK